MKPANGARPAVSNVCKAASAENTVALNLLPATSEMADADKGLLRLYKTYKRTKTSGAMIGVPAYNDTATMDKPMA